MKSRVTRYLLASVRPRLLWLALPLCSGLAVPAVASAAAPTVSTGTPTSITQTGATLNGTVNAQAQAGTTYAFAYDYARDQFCTSGGTSGTAAGYTAVTQVPGDSVNHAVSATITGFSSGDSLCYALVANPNTSGAVVGNLVTFTTVSAPALGVTATSASSLPDDGATFSGSINPEGRSGLNYGFYVGTPSAGSCSGAVEVGNTQSLGYADSSDHAVTGVFPEPTRVKRFSSSTSRPARRTATTSRSSIRSSRLSRAAASPLSPLPLRFISPSA